MNAPLRSCPLCGTKVEEVNLGLRDYRWLGDVLPGRVAPSDLDFILERNGRFLVIEFKPAGASIGMGQRILLKQLVRKGFDVWVAWGDEKEVQVGEMTKYGEIPFVSRMKTDKLAAAVERWFAFATKED